ncbi:LacI family DNA-binding transcriptional regulator [Streptomyces sp. NPDC058430]|uniref:LacI family DNA-binding transcriptional regulator n=1 Tax=Streptomyces sp. NPDC058430 TaxID=3346495 RepID=UPI00364AFCDF
MSGDEPVRRRRNRASGDGVTIAAVAQAAGVSTATVSRVLSGQQVRPGMAEKVRAAVDELGYRPNRAAQDLASGTYRTVGVVVPDLSNPYFASVLKGITTRAAESGYRTFVADAEGDPAQELEVCRNLLRQADSLAVVSPRMPAARLRDLARDASKTVLVNRVAIGLGLPTVAVDTFGAMLELCGHLTGLGHRRLVYLAGPEAAWQDAERRRALGHAGAFGVEVTIVPAGSTIDDGHAAVGEALAHEPTAIVAFNDLVAIGALKGLRERGLRVPEDVSLTGADDIPFASCTEPALTTTGAAQQELGALAWEQMQAMLRGQEAPEAPLVKVALIVRGSTGPAPARGPREA